MQVFSSSVASWVNGIIVEQLAGDELLLYASHTIYSYILLYRLFKMIYAN